MAEIEQNPTPEPSSPAPAAGPAQDLGMMDSAVDTLEKSAKTLTQPPQPKCEPDDLKTLFKLMMDNLKPKPSAKKPKEEKNDDDDNVIWINTKMNPAEKKSMEEAAQEFCRLLIEKDLLRMDEDRFLNKIVNPALKTLGCKPLQDMNKEMVDNDNLQAKQNLDATNQNQAALNQQTQQQTQQGFNKEEKQEEGQKFQGLNQFDNNEFQQKQLQEAALEELDNAAFSDAQGQDAADAAAEDQETEDDDRSLSQNEAKQGRESLSDAFDDPDVQEAISELGGSADDAMDLKSMTDNINLDTPSMTLLGGAGS